MAGALRQARGAAAGAVTAEQEQEQEQEQARQAAGVTEGTRGVEQSGMGPGATLPRWRRPRRVDPVMVAPAAVVCVRQDRGAHDGCMAAEVGEGLHACGGGKRKCRWPFFFWRNRADGGAERAYWVR